MNLAPTVGQLERKLSQQLQAIYKNKLGQQPSKVTCQLLEQKLAIVIEDSITPAEQLLIQEGNNHLVEQVRSGIDAAIEPHIRAAIEEILSVSVEDLLSDATIATGRTGMLAILAQAPVVRSLEGATKPKKSVKAVKQSK